MEAATQAVARHKTAIGRATLSRPVRLALEDGILSREARLFDYGCGRGDDLRILEAMGYEGSGWDPVHRPAGTIEPAPVVNLGYVVNVIEDPRERAETLRRAWALAGHVLAVSARLAAEAGTMNDAAAFADGCLTSRGTFQKLFEQHELKHWIDQTLGTSALPRDRASSTPFAPTRRGRRSLCPGSGGRSPFLGSPARSRSMNGIGNCSSL